MFNREKLSKKLHSKAFIVVVLATVVTFQSRLNDVIRAEETSYSLKMRRRSGDLMQVRTVVEVKGDLLLQPEGNSETRLPLLVNGDLLYDERFLDSTAGKTVRRAVRYYQQAEAKIKIGSATLNTTLRPERRIVVARLDQSGAFLYSPMGPLTRDELDLLDIQGNSLLWDCLLPKSAVKVGDRWALDQGAFGQLLGLEAVTQCEVNGALAKVEAGVAVVEVSGSLSGAVNAVASKISLNAKYNFELARGQVTWFAAAFREAREIGHAEPGLEVSARVRMVAGPITESPTLDQKEVASLPAEPDAQTKLLEFHAEKGHFTLAHERRWRTILERHDLCVFRLVDRGELISQCNISELPDTESNKKFPLDEFQSDVQRSLGKSFGRVEEATTEVGSDGKQIYRVAISGSAGDVPVRWIYYHIQDKSRRAALAFTCEQKLLDRFANADRAIVDSFHFLARPEPRPAEQRAAEKPQTKPSRS